MQPSGYTEFHLKFSHGNYMNSKLLPASFFAMTLGLAETGNAWRIAHNLWALPAAVGELLQLMAALSFVVFLAMYAGKWMRHRGVAIAEARDPVQSAFLALIPESIILIALAMQPYAIQLAGAMFWGGSCLNLLYGAWRLAANWTQQRTAEQIVPPVYLPYAASVLVNALAAGLFGYTAYGWMLFGVGVISWLVLDSAVTQQLMTGGLAEKTRNFMGIYSAPPVVALVAYQVLAGEQAHTAVTYGLAGYAMFMFAGLGFAGRWLARQDFAPGYWAYTFGLATLAQGLMLMCLREQRTIVQIAAAAAFVAALLLVLYVAWGTLKLLSKDGYFPPAPQMLGNAAK